MNKAKTGTENGFRVVRDGTWEPMRQHIEIKSRMFQFDQTKGRGKGRSKKKGRKKHKKTAPSRTAILARGRSQPEL